MIIGEWIKQPAEKFPISVNLAKNLKTGESIVDAVVTSRLYSSGADSTAVFLTGAFALSGTYVVQKVHQGVFGEIHLVEFLVTDSAGEKYEDEIRIRIQEKTPIGIREIQPGEKALLEIDFSKYLAPGETILSAGTTVTSKNLATGLDSSGSLLSGSRTISGSKVLQMIAPLTHHESHHVEFTATTSSGNIWQEKWKVLVVEVANF